MTDSSISLDLPERSSTFSKLMIIITMQSMVLIIQKILTRKTGKNTTGTMRTGTMRTGMMKLLKVMFLKIHLRHAGVKLMVNDSVIFITEIQASVSIAHSIRKLGLKVAMRLILICNFPKLEQMTAKEGALMLRIL